MSNYAAKARVVEIRPKLLSKDAPYGAFGQGTALVLEARLLRVGTIPCIYGPEPLEIQGTDRQCSIRGALIYDEIENIAPPQRPEGRQPTLLELCTVSGPGTPKEVLSLALGPVAGKNMTFKRICTFRIMHEIEDLPEDDEIEKVSSTWVREKLDQRNLFNRASMVKVELL